MPVNDNPVKIKVPSGIGDFSWIYSKLVTLDLNLDVEIPEDGHKRLQPLTDILPCVISSRYGKFNYNQHILPNSIPSDSGTEDILDVAGPIYISANKHLEDGHRIEKFIPDLPIEHHYKVNITDQHRARLDGKLPDGRFICIFVANHLAVKSWNAWTEQQWTEFASRARKRTGIEDFVLIGANWDLQMAERVITQFQRFGIKLRNLVGQLILAESLALIQKSEYFVSFPSGMGIMAEVLEHPTTMMYPEKLTKMIGSWADPKMIEDGTFFETLFCPVDKVIDHMCGVLKHASNL